MYRILYSKEQNQGYLQNKYQHANYNPEKKILEHLGILHCNTVHAQCFMTIDIMSCALIKRRQMIPLLPLPIIQCCGTLPHYWIQTFLNIKYKLLIYIYKILNDLAPVYLKECVRTYVPSREGLRSANDVSRLSIPRSHKLISDGSFSVFGSRLWNPLPLHIRSSPSVDAFKRTLKTHLY